MSPALVWRGMNSMLCMLALLEIIHDLQPSVCLFVLLQELVPLNNVLEKLMVNHLLNKCHDVKVRVNVDVNRRNNVMYNTPLTV
jgi:hypothetical protein